MAPSNDSSADGEFQAAVYADADSAFGGNAPAGLSKSANIKAGVARLFGDAAAPRQEEAFSVRLSHEVHAIISDGGVIAGGGQLWSRQRHGPQGSDGCRRDVSLSSEAEVEQQLDKLFRCCNGLITSCSDSGMTREKKFQAGAYFIHRYLAIHPYCDGNGRVARLLTSLLLVRLGAISRPLRFDLPRDSRQRYIKGLLQEPVTGPESEQPLAMLRDLMMEAADGCATA